MSLGGVANSLGKTARLSTGTYKLGEVDFPLSFFFQKAEGKSMSGTSISFSDICMIKLSKIQHGV